MTDSGRPWLRRWLAVLVLALALYVIVRAADTPQGDRPPPVKTSASPSVPSVPSAGPSKSALRTAVSSYDPAVHAAQVRTRARQTGISARLLMAILCNEAYKPHDPSFERAWQKHNPGAAFDLLALGYNSGAGNMTAFARGAALGSQARAYLDRLHANWAGAGRAVATERSN